MNNESPKADLDNKLTESDKKTYKNDKSSMTKSTKTPQSSKKLSTILVWIFCVLNLTLLVAAGVAGWYFIYPKYEQNDRLAAELEQVQQKSNDIQSQLDSLSIGQQTTSSSVSKQLEALSSKVENSRQTSLSNTDHVKTIQHQLTQIDGRRPSDWLIAEADYLVRMAGRKVWLESDANTAILLLQSADQRLLELDDPSVIPVRSLIADDILTLKSMDGTSVTSIALQLHSLINLATNLPLDTVKLPDLSQVEENTEVSSSVRDWKTNLKNAWNDFTSKYIEINPRQAPLTPMMTEAQQWLARQQLHLALQQAQSAALNHEQELYQASLELALEIIQAHFVVEATEVIAYTDQITSLLNTSVAKTLPENLQAHPALNSLLEKRVSSAFGQGE